MTEYDEHYIFIYVSQQQYLRKNLATVNALAWAFNPSQCMALTSKKYD